MPYGLLGFALLLSAGVPLVKVGVPIVFGHSFAGAVQPLILLLVTSMGMALFNTFMPLISACGGTWFLAWITLGSALVNLATGLVLIPSYGIVGAATATILGYWSAAWMILVVINRLLGVGILRFAWFGLPVIAGAGFGMSLSGPLGYLVGVVAPLVSAWLLARRLGLLDREALSVLDGNSMLILIRSGLVKVFCQKAG